jgi:hypothetical protein
MQITSAFFNTISQLFISQFRFETSPSPATIIPFKEDVSMLPLSVFLFLAAAAAAPQQKPLDVFQDFRHLQLPVMQHRQFDDAASRRLLEESRRNTCFTMRSYFFRRQDGQAPVLAGMTTCTPARVLQQRQVSPAPDVKLVPLALQQHKEK